MKKMSLHTGWSDGLAVARRTAQQQMEAWQALPSHWRWALVGMVGVVVRAIVLLLRLDWSRELTPAELQGFEAWSADTHAAAVAEALQGAKRDRKVTVDEANRVIEVAKAAPTPPGLMEPVDGVR